MVSRENRPKTFESRAAGRTKSAVGVPANGDDGRHQKSLATGMDSAKMKRCPASKPRGVFDQGASQGQVFNHAVAVRICSPARAGDA